MKRQTTDESINLHGMTPDAALLRLRNKCQEPAMKGHSLLVIHGCGRGILRERVRAWAADTGMVKTVWPGEQYNLPGGGGVTLLFLSVLLLFMCGLLSGVKAGEALGDVPVETKSPMEKAPVFVIEIPLPITSECNANLRRSLATGLERLRTEETTGSPTLVFRFQVRPGEEENAKTTLFGDAFELARLIRGKQFLPGFDGSFRSIAWVSGPLAGHALLPVLACDELIVGADYSLGPASISGHRPTEAERSGYREMTLKKGCEPILDALLDPELKLFEYESDTGHGFLVGSSLTEATPEGMAFLSDPVEFPYALGRGVFSGSDLRRIGLVDRTLDVAQGDDSLTAFTAAVPGLDGPLVRIPMFDVIRPGMIRIFGTIGPAMMGQIQRKIDDAFDQNQVNCLILEIESPGGSLADSMFLGNYLANEIDHGKRRVIGYVPNEARGDAALIALSCDELYVGERAILGGTGAAVLDPTETDAAVQVLMESWGPKLGRNASLPAAMIDPRAIVRSYKNRNSGKTDWFTEKVLEQLPHANDWEPGAIVAEEGRLFQITGKEAMDYRLANGVVSGFGELCSVCGIGREPLVVQPRWVDVFLQALASPVWSGILLSMAFALLYIEANSPGIGFAGMFAALFLILFFWANLLGGTAGWLEILLLLFGVILVLLEIFVIPGFGLTGIVGGACILTSLVLATQTFIIPQNFYQWEKFRNSLLMLCIVGIGTVAVGIAGFHTILSRFSLPVAESNESTEEGATASLLGQFGRTTSPCVPSGKAIIAGQWVSVLAEGGVHLEKETPVEVVAVLGNQITVRAVDPS